MHLPTLPTLLALVPAIGLLGNVLWTLANLLWTLVNVRTENKILKKIDELKEWADARYVSRAALDQRVEMAEIAALEE